MRPAGTDKTGRGRSVVQLAAAVPEGVLGVRNARVDCPVGKDEALEQGVGGQAVGPVQPRARDLAAGVESRHAGLAKQAGLHAATGVVLSGDNRDGILGYVDAKLGALASNVWKVGDHFFAGLVADI